MAKQEQPREDLITDATALVDRAEFTLPGQPDAIVVGFRKFEGVVSLFFGDDPVFHFTSTRELRRAYVAGRMLKAESGILVALTKVRGDTEVNLMRHVLSHAEQHALLADLQQRLDRLAIGIHEGQANILREVSATGQPVLTRFATWLSHRPNPIVVAATPRVS